MRKVNYRIKDVIYADGSHRYYPQKQYSFLGIFKFWRTLCECDDWGDVSLCCCSSFDEADAKIIADKNYLQSKQVVDINYYISD